MPRVINILHADPDYRATYFIYRPHSTMRQGGCPLARRAAAIEKHYKKPISRFSRVQVRDRE